LLLNLVAAQGKQVCILDINIAFQNTIEFDPWKRTYNTLPPFFVENLPLHWDNDPALSTVEQYPEAFGVQNFWSMQGQTYAGQKFYQLISGYVCHIGLHRSISDHSVFIWKQESSDIFLSLATNNCLVICDNHSQFLDLKANMEDMFEVTLQEGAILSFLNLRITQSLVGIIIDHMDHVVETIFEPYFKDRDTNTLLPITSKFPTDSSFEKRLYESPVLAGSALHDDEQKYGGSLFHWNGVLLHVALTTRIGITYAIMRIYGYLSAPTTVIFEGLEHIMRYLYFYRHMANPLSQATSE
jgi:hypothetical protein